MRGIATYQSVSKQSAPPERLLLMLYQRIIQRLREAQDHLKVQEISEALDGLRVSREILVELINALDHEAAPALTANLHRLYTWSIRELIAAGRDHSPKRIQNVLGVIEPLYSAWQEVIEA